jgi:hypothetical protein
MKIGQSLPTMTISTSKKASSTQEKSSTNPAPKAALKPGEKAAPKATSSASASASRCTTVEDDDEDDDDELTYVGMTLDSNGYIIMEEVEDMRASPERMDMSENESEEESEESELSKSTIFRSTSI